MTNSRHSNGWAKVPHGIVEAPIKTNIKMLIWLGYDQSEDWTHSVAYIADQLKLTTRTVQRDMQPIIQAGVYVKVGLKKVPYGSYPIYAFKREAVEPFIQAATEPATKAPTQPATEPATKETTNKNNNKKSNKIDSNKRNNKEQDYNNSPLSQSLDTIPNMEKQEMEKFLDDGFHAASVSMPSAPPSGINMPSPSASVSIVNGDSQAPAVKPNAPFRPKGRPFAVVYKDEALRAEFVKALVVLPQEIEGLRPYAVEAFKAKRNAQAIAMMKTKYNLM
jgi:hypothetical protein